MLFRIFQYPFLFLLLLFSEISQAQTLYFQFANGSTASYNTSSIRKVTHSGTSLNLSLTNGTSYTYSVDDIVYYNFEAVPMILSGAASLPDYDSLCVGSASSPLSYSVKGFRLAESIQLTAPAGFEISTSSNSGYTSSLTLSPASGQVNTTVYARFLPDASDAVTGFKVINGLISHTSAGAAQRTTGVLGMGVHTGAYIGPASGNWGDVSNWCGGVPGTNSDVVIPSGKTVVINTTANVKTLHILNGATLKGGASTLSVYGNWSNAGTFLPESGTVAFRGSTEDISLTDDFYNLTINKTSGSIILNDHITVSNQFSLLSDSLIIAPGYRFDLPGTANFGGQRVIIKSEAGGTASIGVLGNNGANLSGATNVTAERYVPAKRAWRLLTAPLVGSSGNSIYDNWQNTEAGSGVTIFSPSGTGASGNGIVKGGIASSILSYNSVSDAWDPVANTKTTTLFESGNGTNKSYALFVTGPAAGGSITGMAQPTTLKPTGTLQTGTVTYVGLAANQFHLIGNPYASPIQLNTASNTVGTNTTNVVYVWDAKGTNLGRYKVWDPILKWSVGGAPSGDNYGNDVIVQSGQAFFIRSSTGSNASVTFTEANKVSNSANNVSFRSTTVSHLMRIELSRMINDQAENRDAAAVLFDEGFSAQIDDIDVVKFPNQDENIVVFRNGAKLVIERRPLLQPTDTVFLRVTNLIQQSYRLGIGFENFTVPAGLSIVLQDIASGFEQTINPGQVNHINFSVTSSNASIQDRFRIVFRNNIITQNANLNASKSYQLYPNPVIRKNTIQLQFMNKTPGMYTVTVYSMNGIHIQQKNIRHSGGDVLHSLGLDLQMAAGVYLVEVMDEKGEKEQLKLTVQ